MSKKTKSGSAFSISLICATKGRRDCILERIPIWSKAGFDEVIIVDGNYDDEVRSEIKESCVANNAIYLPAPMTVKDIRSLQRNLGAKKASSEWIVFFDDDDKIAGRIDRKVLAKATKGKDWLVGPKGEHILFHRRSSFLEMGGYPEDMVAAEDMIMSNRARLNGKGGLEGNIYKKIVEPRSLPKDYPVSRAKNHFWYEYTIFILFLRHYDPGNIAKGDVKRLLILLRDFLRGDLKSGAYLMAAMMGRAGSIFHVLKIAKTSGRGALKREPFGSWQGLR